MSSRQSKETNKELLGAIAKLSFFSKVSRAHFVKATDTYFNLQSVRLRAWLDCPLEID